MAAGTNPPPPAAASSPGRDREQPLTTLQARRLGPVRRWFAEHPRGTDIVVAAWFFVPSLVALAFDVRFPGVHWTLVALTTAALLLRRRYPVHVLAWCLVASVISAAFVQDTGGHEFAAGLAVYAVASLRPPKVAWLATGATVLLLAGVVWLMLDSFVTIAAQPDEPDFEVTRLGAFAGVTSWTTVLTLVAHAIGTSVRSRRLHTQDLVDRTNRLALERDQREQLAAAAERTRIAREMHDVVAHSVSVMVALADGAAASLARHPDRTRRALEELSDTGRDALTEMRSILGVLRTDDNPEGAPPFGGAAPLVPTVADLDDLLDRFRAAGLNVERVDHGPALPQQPGFALTVYRVIQESLTNVLRYAAGASEVRVEITRREDAVDVVVTNDAGTGVVQPGSGHGLLGLRERVGAYGGTVTAGEVGRGWRVHATIPIPEES